MPADGSDRQPRMGLREQHKADKLRRIKAAARKLFLAKGYEATTTREIAELAGVSPSTIFLYARDKRDLVCLMAVDRIESEFARAFQSCDPKQSLLDQVLSICEHLLRNTAKNIPLSRILTMQIMSYQGRHRIFSLATANYERLLVEAVKRGEIAIEDPAVAARTINLLYLAEMRHWIMTEKPHLKTAINDLRRSLELLICGMSYKSTRGANPANRSKAVSRPLPGFS